MLLGGALLAWAIATSIIRGLLPEASSRFSTWALESSWHWLLVLVVFMASGYLSQRLAASKASRRVQYIGLGVEIAAWSVMLQPLLWVLETRFPGSDILIQAAIVSVAIFVGLTFGVLWTKKDFSFLRGSIITGFAAAAGVILASLILGFSLGILFCGFMVLLIAGYILYLTSWMVFELEDDRYVEAAITLFSAVALLFWYVVRALMLLRR